MENKDYKISVITPVYNSREYLGECVESILGQSYKNLELWLIDDGSDDGSGELCDEYAGKDARVKVIHKENGGCCAASLTGISNADGAYCMFVDSDDYIEKNTLEEMAGRLTGKKGEIVCCGHVLEKRRQTSFESAPAPAGIYEGEKLKREIKEKLIGTGRRPVPMSRCMKLYEKSVFAGNEKFCDTKIRMGEDFNLVYPAVLDCTRMVIMSDSFFYHYRYVETSMVHGYDSDMMDSLRRLNDFLLRVAEEKGVKDWEEAVRKEYCFMLLLAMKNELRNPDNNYMEKLFKIITEKQLREIVGRTDINVYGYADKLLWFGLRYPSRLYIRLLRRLIKIYDG